MSLIKKPKHWGSSDNKSAVKSAKPLNEIVSSANPLSEHVAHAHPLSNFVASAHPLSKYVSSADKKVNSLADPPDKFTSRANLAKYTKLADPPDKHSPRLKLRDSSVQRINPLDNNNDPDEAFASAAPLGPARARYNPVK